MALFHTKHLWNVSVADHTSADYFIAGFSFTSPANLPARRYLHLSSPGFHYPFVCITLSPWLQTSLPGAGSGDRVT